MIFLYRQFNIYTVCFRTASKHCLRHIKIFGDDLKTKKFKFFYSDEWIGSVFFLNWLFFLLTNWIDWRFELNYDTLELCARSKLKWIVQKLFVFLSVLIENYWYWNWIDKLKYNTWRYYTFSQVFKKFVKKKFNIVLCVCCC